MEKNRPKPIDSAAKEALEDSDYQKGMEKYDLEKKQ